MRGRGRASRRPGKEAPVRRLLALMRKVPSLIAIGLIMFYRMAISPILPPACRFVPTCSEYGLTAFRRYGFRKGFVLTAKRILRCRPGGPCGYDPVP
ncbi:membrane protein insertion efficiency factor YidD [uncultured Adlercreutzia sp.]|uniref:membrane protein insertion efficiency factor YidD n=1 Tax=uncultured Adlercreutzia sp. TaxID=875803 RepID=UPI00350FF91A